MNLKLSTQKYFISPTGSFIKWSQCSNIPKSDKTQPNSTLQLLFGSSIIVWVNSHVSYILIHSQRRKYGTENKVFVFPTIKRETKLNCLSIHLMSTDEFIFLTSIEKKSSVEKETLKLWWNVLCCICVVSEWNGRKCIFL